MYAIRGDGGDWSVMTPSQYLCPVSSMTIGESWRYIHEDPAEVATATVALQEDITTNAGTFSCYRVDIMYASSPDTLQHSMWISDGAGIIMEAYYGMNEHGVYGYWTDELDDHFVAGTGFMPMTVGNWWVYYGQWTGTEESSWGAIKRKGR